MDLNEFAVDPALYDEGRKLEFGKDAWVKVRSARADTAVKVSRRLLKLYQNWGSETPPDIDAQYRARLVAEGLITEIAGCTFDGQSFDLAKEAERKRFSDLLVGKKWRAFVERIWVFANDAANYQAQADEVLEKNSERSPAGNSSGANAPKV